MVRERQSINVCVLLFDDFELLDAFGPVELLSKSSQVDISYSSDQPGLVSSAQGIKVEATLRYDEAENPDSLLVPGGRGTRTLVHDQHFLECLARIGKKSQVVTSVCTGSALLAASGLLEGYRATSNKSAYSWASSHGKNVNWAPKARWVHDRDRWTSSGVAAGMDMTYALMGELLGNESAETATRLTEYEPHQDSSWDPFADRYGLA